MACGSTFPHYKHQMLAPEVFQSLLKSGPSLFPIILQNALERRGNRLPFEIHHSQCRLQLFHLFACLWQDFVELSLASSLLSSLRMNLNALPLLQSVGITGMCSHIQFYAVLGIELGVSCILDKHSTKLTVTTTLLLPLFKICISNSHCFVCLFLHTSHNTSFRTCFPKYIRDTVFPTIRV